ncbi:MAG: VWA domain-containing protein [Promethearchaeota archaeon]
MTGGLNIENVILLLDTSRSMCRRDFQPSRIQLVYSILVPFIERKLKIDANDRIGIVTFGEKARKIQELTSDLNALKSSLERIEIGGKSNIEDGLAMSIQILINEIRKIGGKVVRIILFSDDRLGKMTSRLITLANAAKGLGIFVDTMIAAPPPKSLEYSVLKNLALITNGDFAYFHNEKAFTNAAVALSSKKDLNDVAGYWASQERELNSAPLLSEIAVELRRPELAEIQEAISNPLKIKCSICHKSDCPVCHGPFYAEGRYCPSCGRPLHLHCAQKWAENSPDAPSSNFFRCPFCYFLIRIPPSINLLEQNKATSEADIKLKEARLIKIPKNRIQDIDGSCGYCHVIFLGEYNVYQCSNCGTYYHDPCVKEMYKKYGGCRTCGSKFSNINDLL